MIQEKYIEEYQRAQGTLRHLREIEAKMKDAQSRGKLRGVRIELLIENDSQFEKGYADLSVTVAERALNQQHTAVYNRVETLDKLIAEDLRK